MLVIDLDLGETKGFDLVDEIREDVGLRDLAMILYSDRELTNLRLNTLGFIFQSFNLVAVLSVFQNVEFPLLLHRYQGA